MNLMMLHDALSAPDRAAAILAECNALTEECLKEIRALSYTLYPPLLDELGLSAALRSFVDLYQRGSPVSVALRLRSLPRFRREVELAAFRVAQESLLNVHRHSGSKRAEVQVIARDSEVQVTVRDWGSGLKEGTLNGDGLGIAGMRERARLLGGSVHIEAANPGTRVRAVLPLEDRV